MRHRSSFLRGFSLLETMIAVGLIGVLIGTIGLFVNQIAGSRTQLRASTSRDALATAIFDGLERSRGVCYFFVIAACEKKRECEKTHHVPRRWNKNRTIA